jgi:hypothetical protein
MDHSPTELSGSTPAVSVRTGDPVQVVGVWLPLDHLEGAGCASEPRRHSLPTALPAPGCPHCDGAVRWHLVEMPSPHAEEAGAR